MEARVARSLGSKGTQRIGVGVRVPGSRMGYS